MRTKVCSKCKKEKSFENDFYNEKPSKDGKSGHCKACMDATHNKYIEENRDRWNDYIRDRYLENHNVNFGDVVYGRLATYENSLHSIKKYKFKVMWFPYNRLGGHVMIEWAVRDNPKIMPLHILDEKKCRKCGKIRSAENGFYDGHVCKSCVLRRDKERRLEAQGKDTAYVEEQVILRYIKNRLKLKSYTIDIESVKTEEEKGIIRVTYWR